MSIGRQLTFLDSAYADIRKLQELAQKIRKPPKLCSPPKETTIKKGPPPFRETANSCLNLQGKNTNSDSSSQASDSEIINFLEQQSSMSFTATGILSIAKSFGSTEGHIRCLISKIVSSKYRR